jgi:hypothetical protein
MNDNINITDNIDIIRGNIYIIKCLIDDNIFYIGSTEKPIKERFKNHIHAMNNKTINHLKIYKAMQENGEDNFYIELLENIECMAIQELRKRDGELIREYKAPLNKRIDGRTNKEYYNEKKEEDPDFFKKYYQLKKENDPEYYKKRYQELKNRNPEYHKLRYHQKKEEDPEYLKKIYRRTKKQDPINNKKYYQLRKENDPEYYKRRYQELKIKNPEYVKKYYQQRKELKQQKEET